MSFRLVPNSMTFNDLERRNSPNGCVTSPNSAALRADYVKLVENTPILSAAEIYRAAQKNGKVFLVRLNFIKY